MAEHTQSIVLGGGCFWCTEAVFQEVKGVLSVTPGYAGGTTTAPTYESVCSGTTGHAEVVKVEFNPSVIALHDILTVFFGTHDPASLNRQGADVGTEYRSTILYSSQEQKDEAETVIQELNQQHLFSGPIVTTLEPLEHFYEAEEYHKNYFKTNPDQIYCQAVINPKLAKFRARFAHLLQK